jgi:protein PhnA
MATYCHETSQLSPEAIAGVGRAVRAAVGGLDANGIGVEVVMSKIPACPQCALENAYLQGTNYACVECGYEWPAIAVEADAAVVRDANGNTLADGDAVVLIKDLKVKGSSTTLKVGTKIKSIRLVVGDHEVDCKMDSGNFMLKACFLRKV